MSTQPEALRLADELDCRGMNRPSWKDQFDAGYQLRRLHEVNAELVEALKQVMLWIENWSPEFSYDPDWPFDRDAAKAALAKAQGDSNDTD